MARGGPGGGGAGALPLGGCREKNRGGSELGAAPDVILTLSPHWVCGVSFFRFIKYHRQDFFLSLEIEIEKVGGIHHEPGVQQVWAVFGDDQMAAALIDRIVHHGRLVQFRGESYRVRHALMQEG